MVFYDAPMSMDTAARSTMCYFAVQKSAYHYFIYGCADNHGYSIHCWCRNMVLQTVC